MLRRIVLLGCLFAIVCGQGNGGGRKPPGAGERQPKAPQQDGGKDAKKFVLSQNGFNVEVNGNGNAPFYSYWADGNEAMKQRVMFAKMWQTDDIENPGGKRLKMMNLIGAYNWVFTDLTNTNASAVVETVFTMTGRPKQGGGPDSPKPDITFTNHLVSSKNGTELKFDVDIANFDEAWWDANSKGLVMAYRIETVNAADEAKNASLKDMKKIKDARRPNKPAAANGATPPKSDVIDLGNGYGFESAQTATSGSTTITATTNPGTVDGEPLIMVTYAKFTNSMRHDPTMYTTSTSSADISSSTATVTYTADGKPSVSGTPAPNPAPTPSSAAVNSPLAYLVSLVVCTIAVVTAA